MTQPLFKFNENTVIAISREGGFAYTPELAGSQRFSLNSMQDSERKQLCQLLNQLSSYALQTGEHRVPDGADQRYFLITISDTSHKMKTNNILEIPEQAMPPALIQLWQTGSLSAF